MRRQHHLVPEAQLPLPFWCVEPVDDGGDALAITAWPSGCSARSPKNRVEPERREPARASEVEQTIPRPSLRKRSGLNGSELWPEKTIVLSELEGDVADVAVAPDGGLWVAMNVKEASQKWRPHILLLTPDGDPAGVDYPGELGYTVRAVAADDEGGCFAVGYAAVEGGDLDVARWRINAMHQSTIADTWGYKPVGQPKEQFLDAGMDVGAMVPGQQGGLGGPRRCAGQVRPDLRRRLHHRRGLAAGAAHAGRPVITAG